MNNERYQLQFRNWIFILVHQEQNRRGEKGNKIQIGFHEITGTGDAIVNKTGTLPGLGIKHYCDKDEPSPNKQKLLIRNS